MQERINHQEEDKGQKEPKLSFLHVWQTLAYLNKWNIAQGNSEDCVAEERHEAEGQFVKAESLNAARKREKRKVKLEAGSAARGNGTLLRHDDL